MIAKTSNEDNISQVCVRNTSNLRVNVDEETKHMYIILDTACEMIHNILNRVKVAVINLLSAQPKIVFSRV